MKLYKKLSNGVKKKNPKIKPENKPRTKEEKSLRRDSIDISLARQDVKICSLEQEVQNSYLDYAMSVIVQRALPDVRDGLKPVHRRILYAMWRLGLRSGGKFRKSAMVVGEVLGKFHPHGDLSVYDAMAHMAQDFSMRYPLIWGQGNFGSIDGDSPAAMRYTEAKLNKLAEELLTDIDKNVVDFVPNYDGALKEPLVLPTKFPNLLLNGTLGIAVGMATNIPPHNLKEICAATCHLVDHPSADVDELTNFIKGPDFPTGGLIFEPAQIKQAYALGRGPVVIRAKTDIIEPVDGQFQFIVSEIPFRVNKSTLLEKIAELTRDKKLEDIRDIRDESDREGIRIVIELKKNSYPQKVLNQLFKMTELQTTFHINMVALVDGLQPRLLNIKSVLEEYIKHHQLVVRRRAEYDLEKVKERIHILKGLKTALDHIDEIIKTIKKSKNRDDAKINLINKFKLSEVQANAILDIKLQQLAGLEREKIETELKEKLAAQKELEEILFSTKNILKVVKSELSLISEKYGDERKTQIVVGSIVEFKQEDLIPNEPTLVIITRDGYIKRINPDTFKTQGRGGKGVIGLETKEEDLVEKLIMTNTHTDLLFFTTKGRVFNLKAYDVPVGSRVAGGRAIVNFLQIETAEKISAVLPLDISSKTSKEQKYLIMVTEQGIIKRVSIAEFANVRRSGLIAIKLKNDDILNWVKLAEAGQEVILITANGQSLRFKDKDLRPMGRAAAGVKGLRLKAGDQVVGMDLLPVKTSSTGRILVVGESGFGKQTPVSQYRLQRRGGSGTKTAKITSKTGKLVSGMFIDEKIKQETFEEDLLIVSQLGQIIRLPLKSVSLSGRATQGVRLMRFKEAKDKVASVILIKI
ncbi:MAG: DNA gyrase subunit A [Patescibacteria group bacterium]